MTVAEYARQWIAARPYRLQSKLAYRGILSNHIEATPLGHRPLAKVKPSEIQAWATGRATVVGPATVWHLVGVLRSIFATAVLDELIGKNPVQPARRLSLPKPERRKVVPPTVEQVQALADAMPPHTKAMVIAQAGLGLRIGELLALRRHDVDFLRREVRIEAQIESATRKRVPPKTPSSQRTVPLPAVVAEALARHMAEFPQAEDGSIFVNAAGRPHAQSNYYHILRRAARRAGLPDGFHSHDLRHHYASVLLHAGESVVAVAERLGHVDSTEVTEVYGHVMPNSEERTRQAIDTAWTSSPAEDAPAGAHQGRTGRIQGA